MNHFQVIPECFADTVLVEMLGFKNPNHQAGIGKVIGLFEKSLKTRLAVGIIDDDKVKPKQLDYFELKAEEQSIKKLTRNNHCILVISPAFEDWVFENAKAVEVDPSKFGFRTRKHFRDSCKNRNASQNEPLKQFLNALKQKKAPGFVQLKTWICEGAGIDPDLE